MNTRAALLACACLALVPARALAWDADGVPLWQEQQVTLTLQLGDTPVYSDGSTPNSTAEAAALMWNPYMNAGRMVLQTTVNPDAPKATGNGINNVFFSNKIYNQDFPGNTLAVTLTQYTYTRRIETDVVVNTAYSWDSYAGPIHSPIDLRRVLGHEFGHVLGLDHPDQAGQSVTALMNAMVGNTATTAADDHNGAAGLYGPGVANTPAPPVVDASTPANRTVFVGDEISLAVVIESAAGLSYQWRKNGTSISGATAPTLRITAAALTDAGGYSVLVSNAAGAVPSREAAVTVQPIPPPAIQSQSQSGTIVLGTTGQLSVILTGQAPFTYQWWKDGAAISGPAGTQASLNLNATGTAIGGSYHVVITNAGGSVTSAPILLTVVPPSPLTRLVNLSTRAEISGNAGTIIAGFVVSGSQNKRILLRGAGPALGAFGVSGALADPVLRVMDHSNIEIARNEAWDATGFAALESDFATAGAFSLARNSSDAALVLELAPGVYTAQISSKGSSSGISLVEVYDLDAPDGVAKLSNLSTRAYVGVDANILIPGLAIGGPNPKRLVIRGVGPSLAWYGVAGTLADPVLEVLDSEGNLVLSNDDWDSSGSATLTADFTTVGAFPLNPGSKDAALVHSFPSGSYTVRVSGKNRTTGIALVEVYELP